MSDIPPLRLGILSTAQIASAICRAAAAVPEIEVVAVASRTPTKARDFAITHNIRHICKYEELLARPDIDAIYIPLPTGLAIPWAVRAADGGKHVLVDKPFFCATGIEEILESAHETGVAFLDGTHFVHSKRFEKFRESIKALDPGAPPKRIVTSFSYPISTDSPDAIRINPALERMGALGDLGWYNFRVAVALLGTEICEHVKTVRCVGENYKNVELPASAIGSIVFENGSSLVFDCDMYGPCRQRVEAVTRTGTARINDFVLSENCHSVFDDLRPSHTPQNRNSYEIERTVELSDADGPTKIIWPEREVIDVEEDGRPAEDMLRTFVKLARAGDTDEGRELRRYWERQAVVTQTLLDYAFLEFRFTSGIWYERPKANPAKS